MTDSKLARRLTKMLEKGSEDEAKEKRTPRARKFRAEQVNSFQKKCNEKV